MSYTHMRHAYPVWQTVPHTFYRMGNIVLLTIIFSGMYPYHHIWIKGKQLVNLIKYRLQGYDIVYLLSDEINAGHIRV